MRIVCDTNVLVRAAMHPNGLAAELLRRIQNAHVSVLSTPILVELLEVLRRDRMRSLHKMDEKALAGLYPAVANCPFWFRSPRHHKLLFPTIPKMT